MGFKTWVAGEVLSAADLMAFLMKQATIVCTSSTRPTPVEGMTIYETDTDLFRTWNGANWLTHPFLEVDNRFEERITVADGGIDAAGSPSAGYADELRFTTATSGADSAISTMAAGSPSMFFDHRATGNGGDWAWRNGTAAATPRMSLTATGELHTASGIITGGNVEIVAGGLIADGDVAIDGDVVAGGAVTSGEIVSAEGTGANLVSFQDNDNHSWESDGAGGWRFANRWSTAAALFSFLGGDDVEELARIADPSANNRTSIWARWKSNDGTERFQELRVSLSGEVDGTSRRYLFVSEA